MLTPRHMGLFQLPRELLRGHAPLVVSIRNKKTVDEACTKYGNLKDSRLVMKCKYDFHWPKSILVFDFIHLKFFLVKIIILFRSILS